MNDAQAQFESRYLAVEKLANGWKLQPAAEAARQLANHFPNNSAAYFMLALIAGMMGQPDLAEMYRNQARRCPDWNLILEGDLLRDDLLTQLRIRRVRKDQFDATYAHIFRVHVLDRNRLACANGVYARFCYATRRWAGAWYWHSQAAIGLTKPLWQFNNLLPYIKAGIMVGRRRAGMAPLYQQLRKNCPPRKPNGTYYGTRAILWQARLCWFGGKVGCRLHDAALFVYWRWYKRA